MFTALLATFEVVAFSHASQQEEDRGVRLLGGWGVAVGKEGVAREVL